MSAPLPFMGDLYRKLARARVSYLDDFFISYRVYMMMGYFMSRLLVWIKVHFMSIKYTCDSKSQTLRMRYRPIQFTCKPISHRNRWSFRVYMILLRNFVPEWISSSGTITRVNLRRGDSRRHDILWWYHVSKYRAMRGNRSELAPALKSSRCHVNTPLHADHWGNFLCPV